MYFVLAIGLSFFLNLGFFFLLVLVHLVLDIAKHRMIGASWKRALGRGAREGLVDLAFLFVGLVLGLYVFVGLAAGLPQAGRAIAAARVSKLARFGRIAARTASAQRFVETFMQLFLYLDEHNELVQIDGEFTKVEKAFVIILVICLILLAVSPWLIGVTPEVFLQYLSVELVPRLDLQFTTQL